MEVDIYQKLKADFCEKTGEAREILSGLDAKTKGLVSAQVVRAVIFLSHGSLTELKQNCDLALWNNSELLRKAEFSDSGSERVRDFNRNFHQLNLIRG